MREQFVRLTTFSCIKNKSKVDELLMKQARQPPFLFDSLNQKKNEEKPV